MKRRQVKRNTILVGLSNRKNFQKVGKDKYGVAEQNVSNHDLIHLMVDVVLVQYYGWVMFLAVLVWLFYHLRRIANNERVVGAVEWVFLEVKIDELNEKSPLAMEQIFAAMHAIHTNYTFGEILAGKSILWMSCEIVSLGGKVSYIFKLPARYRTLFESACLPNT